MTRDEEMESLIVLLALWVERNPNAVAGDAAGEELLDIARSIAKLIKDTAA